VVAAATSAASTFPAAPAAAPAANDPAIAVALALLLVVVAVVGCCSALVAVSAAESALESESLRSDRRLAAFLGQGKCVTRPSLTQWQQEETRPTTRTLCIYDTVTLTLTRPSHRARA
jgi:hypothetical protein